MQRISVFVKLPNQLFYLFGVFPDEPIFELSARCLEHIFAARPLAAVVLSLGARDLHPQLSLDECGVGDGAVLDARVQLMGADRPAFHPDSLLRQARTGRYGTVLVPTLLSPVVHIVL